jgi:hypothetical protein
MVNELYLSLISMMGVSTASRISSSVKLPLARVSPCLEGLVEVSRTITSRLGSTFGRVKAKRMTFSQPEDANNVSANAVAAKGTYAFALENVVHRTTVMGRTCLLCQRLCSTCHNIWTDGDDIDSWIK